VGAASVKCGDIGGGTTEATGMPECTGVSFGMVEPTRIVEDRANMADCTGVASGIAESS
jgi:hypothetical protein